MTSRSRVASSSRKKKKKRREVVEFQGFDALPRPLGSSAAALATASLNGATPGLSTIGGGAASGNAPGIFSTGTEAGSSSAGGGAATAPRPGGHGVGTVHLQAAPSSVSGMPTPVGGAGGYLDAVGSPVASENQHQQHQLQQHDEHGRVHTPVAMRLGATPGASPRGFGLSPMVSPGGAYGGRRQPEEPQLTHMEQRRLEKERQRKRVGASQLQRRVTVRISETPTVTLLRIPSVRVWGGDEEVALAARAKNAAYADMLEDHKNRDKYVDSMAQTLNESTRDKAQQTQPPAEVDVGVGATAWDIYDTFNTKEEGVSAEEEAEMANLGMQALDAAIPEGEEETPTTGASNLTDAATTMLESVPPTDGGMPISTGGVPHVGAARASAHRGQLHRLMHKPSFRESLHVLECALVQNEMHAQQRLYLTIAADARTALEQMRMTHGGALGQGDEQSSHHGLVPGSPAHGFGLSSPNTPDASRPQTALSQNSGYAHSSVSASGRVRGGKSAAANAAAAMEADAVTDADVGNSDGSPQLTHLWSYACPKTDGLRVTCMTWNKENTDVLAAGYGNVSVGAGGGGYIMCWTRKNPTYPEKVIETKSGVTSLDMSSHNPHLLACGMFDGTVAIYDIRESTGKPTIESQHPGKHSEPVWGVKWVSKGHNESGEHLTSISTDGTVRAWSIKKGLIPRNLMQLKRVPNLAQLNGQTVEGISRQASGLCFDFGADDESQYLTGTEDGLIHRCSVSYNEQTLDTYYGHTGAVYSVQCSPFLSNVFISCSADWTAALWLKNQTEAVHTFQPGQDSGKDSINDITWSPTNSTVFSFVSRDGRVEIWDLEKSTLDPVIRYNHHDGAQQLSCVLFDRKWPVILTGTASGSIDVFRVDGVKLTVAESDEEQAGRLMDTIDVQFMQ